LLFYNSFTEKQKNKKYKPSFKLEVVTRVLNGASMSSVASEICVGEGLIYSWFKKYKELGYNGLVGKKKGRPRKMKPKRRKTESIISNDEKDKRIKELEEKNAQLEMENDLLKKLSALVQQRQQQQNKKK
jgi:transposase-like protein